MRRKRKIAVDPSNKCWGCESPLTKGAWVVDESEGHGEPIHTTWLGCEECTRSVYEEKPLLSFHVETREESIRLPLEDFTRFALEVANVAGVPREQQRVVVTVGDRRIELPRWNEEMKPLSIEEC